MLAQCDVDYLRPVPYREESFAVTSRVTRVGERSFAIAGELRDGEAVLTSAHVVLVCVDAATGRSMPIPQDYRELLSSKVLTMN